ncbi:aldehyde dehydrogenase family protein [Streptomyces sp. NPDC056734]|uniref:aldehyde dehydrogenase family protein n=1 Tax=Streptomyces sp. NPDC056734 TaxID=3345931 RepID=UPI0036ABA9FE
MTARAEEFAELIVLENGKTLTDARAEVAYAAEFFRWYAEESVRTLGSVRTAPSGGNKILVLRQPVGVSVLVTPWNFPAAMATRKVGPALAAGCTVILKPATDTPLTALAVAALFEEAGVPAGVVNVLPSRRSGAVVGTMLDDPRVRKLSFTGSTEVGRTLLAAAARTVVNCSVTGAPARMRAGFLCRWLRHVAEDQPGPVEDVHRADVVRVRGVSARRAPKLRLGDTVLPRGVPAGRPRAGGVGASTATAR